MGIRELRKLASSLGIVNYSKLHKPELQAAINERQAVADAHNAVAQAVNQTPAIGPEFRWLGEVNRIAISVGPRDTVETAGLRLGMFNKSNARKVRKLFYAAGFRAFAAAKRIVYTQAQKKVA